TGLNLPCPRAHGVFEMQCRRIVGADGCGDPALRKLARRRRGMLGARRCDERDATRARVQCGDEPGCTGAENEDVGVDRVHAARRAMISNIRSMLRLAAVATSAGTSMAGCRSASAPRMPGSVIDCMCGHRLQGRTNSVSGNSPHTLSAIEHSVISIARSGFLRRSAAIIPEVDPT